MAGWMDWLVSWFKGRKKNDGAKAKQKKTGRKGEEGSRTKMQT
jgi:hypothetical protein